jgi:hypothetical protein
VDLNEIEGSGEDPIPTTSAMTGMESDVEEAVLKRQGGSSESKLVDEWREVAFARYYRGRIEEGALTGKNEENSRSAVSPGSTRCPLHETML